MVFRGGGDDPGRWSRAALGDDLGQDHLLVIFSRWPWNILEKKCHVTRRETGHQQHGRRTKVFFNNLKNKGYPRTGTAIIARPGSPGRREECRRRDFRPIWPKIFKLGRNSLKKFFLGVRQSKKSSLEPWSNPKMCLGDGGRLRPSFKNFKFQNISKIRRTEGVRRRLETFWG